MKRIRVRLDERSYDIIVGPGLIKGAGALIEGMVCARDAVIVTNARIRGLFGARLRRSLAGSGLSVRFETVPDSERAKSIGTAAGLARRISAHDKFKEPVIIALGGGVIGDLAGFVAAVYKRGIPYIQIPTTLLAQVDSAIGGKVALDLPAAKNLMGAFYQPRVVISDVSVLKTLPLRQLRNGLAEIAKYGVIEDARLFAFLEENYRRILTGDSACLEECVMRSSKIKARIVERDEYDRKGLRASLNLGHTIGHAIEAAAGYSSRYSHGEAVAAGMVAACGISVGLGIMHPSAALRIRALLSRIGLPAHISGVRFSDIYEAHKHDKKFLNGKNRFVLPSKVGAVRIVEDVPDSEVRKAIRALLI